MIDINIALRQYDSKQPMQKAEFLVSIERRYQEGDDADPEEVIETFTTMLRTYPFPFKKDHTVDVFLSIHDDESQFALELPAGFMAAVAALGIPFVLYYN